MLFCFIWLNRFAITRELSFWKSEFVSKVGSNNIYQYDHNNWSSEDIVWNIFSEDFFGLKKLIILWDIPAPTKTEIANSKIEQFEKFLSENIQSIIQGPNIVIFASTNPDKRKSLYKKIQTINANKEYSWKTWKDKLFELKSFDPLSTSGAKMLSKDLIWHIASDDVIDKFVNMVWLDEGNIHNEAHKLIQIASYHQKDQITEKTLGMVIHKNIEQNVFSIIDFVFSKKIDYAISIVDFLQKDWVTRNEFLWWFNFSLRKFIFFADCRLHKLDTKKYWVQSVNVKYDNNVFADFIKKLENLFVSVVDMERKIKNWIIPEEIFWIEIKKMIYFLW